MHKIHTRSFSFIMCLVFIMNLFLAVPVFAAGETVVINGPDESESKVFTADNMLPGDKLSQDYILNISHKKDIEVMFKADVHEGYEILAEVLKFKVTVAGQSEPLYDGLMKDMTAPVLYTLPKGEKSVTYRLSVYLETSVGNKNEIDTDGKRYQNQSLKADFSWWYMPESSSSPSTSGGSGGVSRPAATKLLRRAYVIGRPTGEFEPEAPISRAETATIFARIFADYNEDNLQSTDTSFVDVKQTDWFVRYISRAEKEQIIFGYDGSFRPDDSITRAEFATICVRFFEKRSDSVITPADISFTDFDSSHWAYESIEKAYANKYVTGYPDGTLKADNTITRAEAVTIVNRMLERIPDKEYIDKNLHKLIDFTDVRNNEYWAYYEIFEAANTHYVRFINGVAKWVD